MGEMSSVVHEDVALKIREAFIRNVRNLDLTVRRVLITELIQVFCKYILCNNCKLVFFFAKPVSQINL